MDINTAIRFSIKNIISEGLTDIFPRPYEVDLLKDKKFEDKVFNHLKESIEKAIDENTPEADRLQTLKVHPIAHVLYPKKEAFDFRKCALIDPLDTLKYSSLVLLIATDIEKARIKKSNKNAFSYRLKPEDRGKTLFDKEYNFTSFNTHTAEKTKKKDVKILVKCDISNFYDRLNLHRLESSLLSITKKRNVVKLINELLLFWANRDSYGLPVGSNASRILAESLLIDIDKYLISHQVKFCRYVDDYRLFAPDAKTAHYWLTLLIERLSIEGLFMNQSKTIIEDVTEKIKTQENKNESKDEEVEINIQKEANKNEKKLISGYSGTIPTKFRNSSENEITKIEKTDSTNIIKTVEESRVILPEQFREYCKVILYQKLYTKFKKLPELLNNFPQFTPYVIDLIIKHRDKLPIEVKNYLKSEFSNWINSPDIYLPEYIAISIVKLLSIEDYKDSRTLFDYYRNLKRNAGSYIGRTTLESLENIINRGEVLEIRQYYNRADLWEKRQIVKIVGNHLHKEEKNAWFKNIKMNESEDLFLIKSIS